MIEQVRLFEDPKEIKDDQLPKIMDFIPEGRENAVSMWSLSLVLRTDQRSIRKMVHDARISGQIICSDENGYYQPTSDEEMTRWIHKEESSLISKNKALMPAKKAHAEGRYPSTDE